MKYKIKINNCQIIRLPNTNMKKLSDKETIATGGGHWFSKNLMTAICKAVCTPLPEPACTACKAACEAFR